MALCDNLIIICKAGFNYESELGLEEELRGMVESLKMAKNMVCVSANFFFDSTDIIWSLQKGFGGGDRRLALIMEGVELLQ